MEKKQKSMRLISRLRTHPTFLPPFNPSSAWLCVPSLRGHPLAFIFPIISSSPADSWRALHGMEARHRDEHVSRPELSLV